MEDQLFKIFIVWSTSAKEHFVDEFEENNIKDAENFIKEIREKELNDKNCRLEKILYG